MSRSVNIFQSVPFLRIVLWFTAGILFNRIFTFSGIVWYAALFLSLAISIVLSYRSTYRAVTYFNYLISACLFLSGIWYASQDSALRTELPTEPDFYSAVVLERPVEKNKSFQTILEIKNPEEKTRGKIIAYFSKDTDVGQILPGTRMTVFANLTKIQNQGNPYEFDYATFMKRQGITRSVYLRNNDFKILKAGKNSLLILAEQCRDYLLSVLREHNISGEEYTVVAALTLGYKKELDPATKDYFASTGAMHVLAVSGLHVGIIYFIFTFLFAPLKREKYGRHVVILVGGLIWFYAILTGLSPSVQRASVMFSFILIGQSLNRPANIFNSLAASAFLLMLFNPLVIYDVGFQLSYLAVSGIILFQPVFHRMVEFKNRWADKLWTLLTVSLAAQLATFPVGLLYFSRFPNYFWLSNFIVIPAATLILGGTFLLFLASPVPLFADFIGFLIQKLTSIMLSALKGIDSLPFALISNISVTPLQTILLLLFIATIYWFIQSKSIHQLRLALLFASVFSIVSFADNIRLMNQEKMIVYNSKYPVLHFIHGRNSYILCDTLKTEVQEINRLSEEITKHLKLKKPQIINCNDSTVFVNNELAVYGNLISFSGKKMQIVTSSRPLFPSDYTIIPCLLYNKIKTPRDNGTSIFVGKVKKISGKKFNNFQTSADGAFVADFK